MSSYIIDKEEMQVEIINTNPYYVSDSNGYDGEYDIFTDSLPVFSQVNQFISSLEKDNCTYDNEQTRFLVDIIDCIKERFQEEINKGRILSSIPTIEISTDEDKAIILVWQFHFFRVFFDIELSIKDSFYGYLGKDETGGTFSQTKFISTENYNECIDEIMNNVLQML